MNITVLDFETYYDDRYSLKKMTIPEFVHDPRFHVHGLAVRWPDGNSEFRADVKACLEELQTQFGTDLEKTTVVCHNAQFDLYVLNLKYGIRPRHFTDTMLLAYHVHGRREGGAGQSATLGALADRYGLEAKGDLGFMRGVKYPNAQQAADLSDYARRDVEITAQLAERLLPKITHPEVELPILMHTVRLSTERSIRIDLENVERLRQAISSECDRHLESAGVTSLDVSSNARFTHLLAATLSRSGRTVPLKQGKRGLIPATAKTDPEMQAMVTDDDPHVVALASARLNKKGQDQKLARLGTLQRIASATGGFLPVHLVYYGSHTGRFAGGGGFNVQNMGRSGVGLEIRGLLLPKPEYVFVIADLAQIEARVTAWLAQQVNLLNDFEQGRDVYSSFASQIFGRDVHDPRDTDSPDDRDELKRLRQVGKQAILGLGYGMGAKKFMDTLRRDALAGQLFTTGALDPLRCWRVVDTFRTTYPCIPQFWKELERAVRNAIDGVSGAVGILQVLRDQDDVLVILPSGRALRYQEPRLDGTPRSISYLAEDGNEKEFTPNGPSIVYGNGMHIYGGKLCENVVQATARDLLVEAILQLEDAGLPVAFHVHDEVIVEVPETRQTEAEHTVGRILRTQPSWAVGLPIDCKVNATSRYGK